MLARGTLYMLLGQTLLAASGYLVNVGLGKWLGPAEFGRFAAMASLVVILETVFLIGMPRALSKQVAETQGGSAEAIRYCGILQLLTGTLLLVALFTFAEPLARLLRDPALVEYLRIVALTMPAIAVFQFYTKLLNGMTAFHRQALALTVFCLLRVVLTFTLVALVGDVAGALWALTLTVTAAAAVAWALYRGENAAASSAWSWRPTFAFALQFVLFLGAWTFLDNADQLFVKVLSGADAEAGYYAAAALFGKIPRFLAFAMSAAIFPLVARLAALQSRSGIVRDLRQAIRGFLILVMPIAALSLTLGHPLLKTFFGAQYSPAGQVLWLLVLGSVLIGLSNLLATAITATGGIFHAILAGLLMVLINSALCLLLIPWSGIAGAAMATTLTALVGFALLLRYVTREFGPVLEPQTWLRVCLASATIGALASPLENISGFWVLPLCAGLFFVYFGLLVLLGELKVKDIRVLVGAVTNEIRADSPV